MRSGAPLAVRGAIIAILVDASDMFLLDLFDLKAMGGYQQFDKLADQAYAFTFLRSPCGGGARPA